MLPCLAPSINIKIDLASVCAQHKGASETHTTSSHRLYDLHETFPSCSIQDAFTAIKKFLHRAHGVLTEHIQRAFGAQSIEVVSFFFLFFFKRVVAN